MSNCRVIALTNQKGGVGKTTTALNLGIGLANTGKRVLLIDSDPQGSLTAALGWKNSDGLEVTLSSIYGMLLDDKLPKTPSYGILHSQEGVDLLPCDIMLSGTEMALMSSMCRESHLKRYIEFVKNGYDYILIDCLPTLGILVQNALTAATEVLIPTQAQFLSTKGLTQLLHTISQVRRGLNPALTLDGILFTMVESRVVTSKALIEMLREQYSDFGVLHTEIPKAVRFQDASLNGVSIFKEDKNGKGSQAFETLVQEIVNMGEQKV